MWNDEKPTRPDHQRVKIVQEQERATWKPPRRQGDRVAIAWKDLVSADLTRDGRSEPK